MDEDRNFRTMRGYESLEDIDKLSPALEDYLEMAARLSAREGLVRVGQISQALQVKPSSASKMITKLVALKFLTTDRQGNLFLTAAGKKMSEYFLFRHRTIEAFLTHIGSENPLMEAERIEHFLSPHTVFQLDRLLKER